MKNAFPLFSLSLYFNYYIFAVITSFSVTNASRFLLPLACRTINTALYYGPAQESGPATDDIDEGLDVLSGQAARWECRIPVSL